ncbi:MAG: hypothetical protein JRJ19_16085, partial [Deltaproteobacteria bacterium]|nr:hypothetical protein [Deltaproteobacteria bacterium]
PANVNTICTDQLPGGPCSGDSGGPAFVVRDNQEYVAGVVSYGITQDCSDFGANTKVDEYESRIVDFIGRIDGSACIGSDDCDSTYCVDSVCCATACDDACRVCNLPGALGTCSIASDSTPCPDADLCNGEETCQSGACQAGTQLACDDGNVCTADSCEPASGCSVTSVADDTPCPDANPCDGVETCQNGVCQDSTVPACDDQNPCTYDSCDPASGCFSIPKSDGESCANDDVCDGDELCQGAVCQIGVALDCDDNDACTTDSCDVINGCSNISISCDDSNLCTTDSCDAQNGCQYENVLDGTPCGSQGCDSTESCINGACISGNPVDCDDNDPCTIDRCEDNHGCVHDALPDGFECGECMQCQASQCVQDPDCSPGSSGGCGFGPEPAGKNASWFFAALILLGLLIQRRP